MDNMANTCKEEKVPKGKDPERKSKRLSSSEQKENRPKTQKRNKKPNNLNGSIAMSRQLQQKNKTSVVRQQSARNKPRVCPNGKPMPSLAELEAMYADSDSDDEKPSTPTPTALKPEEKNESILSPNSIEKLNRVKEIISNINDPAELLERIAPPPPVIPPKKRRKSDIPYIVGCAERPQVPKPTTTSFCKGDADYGVENPSLEDMDDDIDVLPRKKAKQSKIPSYNKSIFNIQSDSIARMLINEETSVENGNLSDGSDKTVEYTIPEKEIPAISPCSDSNKTVDYDCTQYQRQEPLQFSPLPSTSRDTDTFKKNDERFNESFNSKNLTNIKNEIEKAEDEENDIDFNIIESEGVVNDEVVKNENITPIETEDLPPVEIKTGRKSSTKSEKELELILTSCDTIVLDDDYPMPKTPRSPINYGDDLEIVECNIPNRTQKLASEDVCVIDDSANVSYPANNNKTYSDDVLFVDEYKDINITNDYSTDDVEIIDVDELIANTQSILQKYKIHEPKITEVIEVPNTPTTSSRTAPNNNNTANTVSSTITVNTNENNNKTNSNENNNESNTTANKNTCDSNSTANQNDNSDIRTIVNNFFKQNSTNLNNRVMDPLTPRNLFDTLSSTISRLQAVFNVPLGSSNINRQITSTPVQVNQTLVTSNNQGRLSLPNRNLDGCSITSSPVQVNQTSVTASINNQGSLSPPKRNLGDCPICMDPLANSGIASTICGHVFCLKCLQTAIKASGKRCPTCRKVLKGAGFHQIYL